MIVNRLIFCFFCALLFSTQINSSQKKLLPKDSKMIASMIKQQVICSCAECWGGDRPAQQHPLLQEEKDAIQVLRELPIAHIPGGKDQPGALLAIICDYLDDNDFGTWLPAVVYHKIGTFHLNMCPSVRSMESGDNTNFASGRKKMLPKNVMFDDGMCRTYFQCSLQKNIEENIGHKDGHNSAKFFEKNSRCGNYKITIEPSKPTGVVMEGIIVTTQHCLKHWARIKAHLKSIQQ